MMYVLGEGANKIPQRKYIDDLGIEYKDTPQGWNASDNRLANWKKERKEYGFDERETWALDYSLMLWLYERLMMYNEINIIDTSFHNFEYEGEGLTFQDCIDRMIEGARIYLTTDENKRTDEQEKKIDDVLKLLSMCWQCLWW